jgi:hypothetical protein
MAFIVYNIGALQVAFLLCYSKQESQILKPEYRSLRSKFIIEKDDTNNNEFIDKINIDVKIDDKNMINEIGPNNNNNNNQLSNSLRRRSQILIGNLINDNEIYDKNNNDIESFQYKYNNIDNEDTYLSSPITKSSPLKLSSLSFSPIENINDDNINIPSTIQRRRASKYLYLPPSTLDINQKKLYIALMKWMHFLIFQSTKKKISKFPKPQILKQQSEIKNIESHDYNESQSTTSLKSVFKSLELNINEIKQIENSNITIPTKIIGNNLSELNEINNNNVFKALMKWIKYVYLRRNNDKNMYLNIDMVIKIREVWIQDILLNKFISWYYNKIKVSKLNLISDEWRERKFCKKFFKLMHITITSSRKVKYQVHVIENKSSRSMRKVKTIIMNGIHIRVWGNWMRWIFGSILSRVNFNIKMVCFISRSVAHWKFNTLAKCLLTWLIITKKSKKYRFKKRFTLDGYCRWRQNQLSKYLQCFLSKKVSIKKINRALKRSNSYYRKKRLHDILRYWWRATYQRITLQLETGRKISNNNVNNSKELIYSQRKLYNQQRQIKKDNYEELNIVGNSLRILINRVFIKDIFQDWKLILKSNSHFKNVIFGKFLLICYSRSISRSFSQQMYLISDISHLNYQKRFVLNHLKRRVKKNANQLQYFDKKISKSVNENIDFNKRATTIKLSNVYVMLNDVKNKINSVNNINYKKHDKINNHSKWLNENNESNFRPPVNPFFNLPVPPSTKIRGGKKNHL